ncbi:hypothetical protein B0F90DRAFT_1683870, partial [Multifurca ochricompacta]
PKMPPPAVAGFVVPNPNKGPPVVPAFVPLVLPNRLGPVVPEVPMFEFAFPNSPPPAGGPEGPVVAAGFDENNPEPPKALPELVPAPAGVDVGVFAFPLLPKTLLPVPKLFPVVPGAAPQPPDAFPAPIPPNAVLLAAFAFKLPKRPPVAGVEPGADVF